MDQCEDREEGVPPSKSTLCGEHESQTKAQRKKRGTKRKHEPEPSFVSLKSDWSAHRPINFKVQPVSAAERNQRGTKRKHEPEPRKCDRSRSPPIEFKVQPVSAAERGQRSQSAGSSCPSVRSDYSKEPPPAFSAEPGPTRVEPAGVRWLRPGLRKYSCQLTIDTNTVHRNLQLSDNNRKVTNVEEIQSYPDHPDRFYVCEQLLCRNGLTGRCYWEVEWRGNVSISVSYRSIRRKGNTDCLFGHNDQSWSLECTDDGPVRVWHDNIKTYISSSSSSSSSVSNRAAVYVDCPAGTLSFYRVSSDTLIHLHTFNTTFTQTLYPGIGVGSDILKFFSGKFSGASVSLC